MNFPRSSGILLHPTSLPGPFGIGDLGPQAHRFAEQLGQAGQRIWQVLPLGPIGKGDSPYQCLSSFAGNPLLISPELLAELGYVSAKEIAGRSRFSASRVEFERVAPFKQRLLRRAFAGFSETAQSQAFERRAAPWLDPFARFMALKSANRGRPWTKFDPKKTAAESEIRFHKFVQYEFFRQWAALKKRCASLGISVLGDISFYLEHDSAEVWAHPEYFDLDGSGEPKTIGGVPPDYFSATGQLWSNPTYRWDRLEKSGFGLWIDRLRASFELVDLLRLDHFRGFEAFWSVPSGERTARNGRWVKGPGARLFTAARNALGELPIVAENLGMITPEVDAIRREFGFPGMAVLQFAFGDDDSIHRPHNYDVDLMAFTGTHDNDTTRGWWNRLERTKRNGAGDRARAAAYLQLGRGDRKQIHWRFIAAVLTSVARLAVIPLQDVLGLGSEARMNVPGRARGNWRWRVRSGAFDTPTMARLRELTHLSGR